MPRIVVLGTGTNVGKTYVTAQLARALSARQPKAVVTAIKPVESGTGATAQWDEKADPIIWLSSGQKPSGCPTTTDAGILASASTSPYFAAVHAFQFAEPISPHLAARRAGSEIDPALVVRWVQACTRSREAHRTTQTDGQHWVLIETAGATHSPLGPSLNNAALAALLEPAIWLLVAPDRLGVLHDVTTTLSALRVAGRVPDLLVLSQPHPHDSSTGTNRSELELLRLADVAGVVPVDGSVPTAVTERLIRLARDKPHN